MLTRSILDPRRYPDPAGRAAAVKKFAGHFTIWDGARAGDPVQIFPFLECILRTIYGPTRKDGLRAVSEAAIWMPRGNAKTTLLAILSILHLYMLKWEGHQFAEPGGQVLIAAADREQARICFDSVVGFVEGNRNVNERLQITNSHHRIDNPKTRGWLRAVSRESRSKHGFGSAFAVCDEIHAWGADGADLHGTIKDGGVKRLNPLVVNISTAGRGSGGLAREKWDYSEALLRGEINDPSFAAFFIGALPEEMESGRWKRRKTIRAANPGIKHGIINEVELQNKLAQAAYSPSLEARFRQYHLNEWQDAEVDPLFNIGQYDKMPKRRKIEDGASCAVAIDVARLHDMLSVSAVFPDAEEPRGYDVINMAFTHQNSLERRSQIDRAKYTAWLRAGYMRLGGAEWIENGPVRAYIRELRERYDVAIVLADPYQASELINEMDIHDGIEVFKQRQVKSQMFVPVQTMYDAVEQKRWRHGGDPCLRYCVANCRKTSDDLGNFYLSKTKSVNRIDSAVSGAMATGWWESDAGKEYAIVSPWRDNDFSMTAVLDEAMAQAKHT